MIELPDDFPHQPPDGYCYEAVSFKRSVIAIWLLSNRRWIYNSGNQSRTIWGFYNTKKRTYHAPINSKRVGDTVDPEKTRAWTAMPLLKLALDSADPPSAPSILSFIPTDDDSMTAQSFADFAATQQARNDIQLNVRKYTLMLCDALEQNFKDRNHGKIGQHEAPEYKFVIESGRKYHKIIMEVPNHNRPPSRSVHAFVDKKTGEVYKPASFKAPAKHVRFNLLVITEREWLLQHADWAGGYLYKR